MNNKNFNLKSLRVRHQYTQEQLANLINMAETTYNRKENGINEFTISEAEKIAQIFKVSPLEIFFSSELPNK